MSRICPKSGRAVGFGNMLGYRSSRKIPLCSAFLRYKGPVQAERYPYARQFSAIRVPFKPKDTFMPANSMFEELVPPKSGVAEEFGNMLEEHVPLPAITCSIFWTKD